MKLTKHEHACAVFEKDGDSIVIDPGSFSAGAADIGLGLAANLLGEKGLPGIPLTQVPAGDSITV